MTPWTMTNLMNLATGYWQAAALNAAVTLGIFEALDARAANAGELAQQLHTSPHHTGELLAALAGLGVLTRGTDGRYAIETSARPFLSPRGKASILGALHYNNDLYPIWGRLAETVRSGQPAVPPHAHLGDDPERTRRFVAGMQSRALGLAPSLLPALPVDAGGTLLDVACGGGTFSRLLAETHAALRVTQFDLPPVLAIAREFAEASPAAPRLSFVPGDYRNDALPSGFDTVLYCGALHQETPESATALFRQLRSAMKPGGKVLVVDLMTDATATQPVFARLFSINMMLTNSGGRVFTVPEVEAMLREAGFTEISVRLLPDIPYGVAEAK